MQGQEHPASTPPPMDAQERTYLVAEASDCLIARRYDDARRHIARVLAVEPQNGQARNLRGLCALREGDIATARSVFRALIEEQPQEASLRLNLAMVEMKAENHAEAAAHLQELLRLKPDHAKGRALLDSVQQKLSLPPATAAQSEARQPQMPPVPLPPTASVMPLPSLPTSSGGIFDEASLSWEVSFGEVPIPPPLEASGALDESATTARFDTFDSIPATPQLFSDAWAELQVEEGEQPAATTEIALSSGQTEEVPVPPPLEDPGIGGEIRAATLSALRADARHRLVAEREPSAPAEPENRKLRFTVQDDTSPSGPPPGSGEARAQSMSGSETRAAPGPVGASIRPPTSVSPTTTPATVTATGSPSVASPAITPASEQPTGEALDRLAEDDLPTAPKPPPAREAVTLAHLVLRGPRRDGLCLGPPGSPLEEAVALSVTDVGYLRSDRLVSLSGNFEIEPLHRRYRGRRTDSLFGGTQSPLISILGEGEVWLDAREGHVQLLRLDNEELYLTESVVLGFTSGLVWENGRLPDEQGADLDVVHLRGTGTLALLTRRPCYALEVTAAAPVTVHAERLVGWSHGVAPARGVLPGLPTTSPRLSIVRFDGGGSIILG